MNRRSILLSAAGHALLLVVLLVLQASSGRAPALGGDAVWVDMVTLADPASEAPVDPDHQENPVEDVQENPVEDVQENPVEDVQENPVEDVQEVPVEDVQENPVETPDNPADQIDPVEVETVADDPPAAGWVTVDAAGEPGAGSPGPATYEGRVFAAIRRNFRTSVEPPRSYRIEFTVASDGTFSVEIIRDSGDAVFDRAVDHALTVAQIPPFPAGRTSPAVLRIEFLGPSGQQ